jgi:hypothetical protein
VLKQVNSWSDPDLKNQRVEAEALVDQGPDVDVLDVLRRISMGLIVSGHDQLGGRMLNALRPQMAEPADVDASIALAEFARGDVQQARKRVEQDVLVIQPSHPFSLLVKAACDRSEGKLNWQKGPNSVLSMSDKPQWRRSALDMLGE